MKMDHSQSMTVSLTKSYFFFRRRSVTRDIFPMSLRVFVLRGKSWSMRRWSVLLDAIPRTLLC